MDAPLYFWYTIILLHCIYVRVPHFYDLSAFVGCWSLVSVRRIIYKFLNVCPFDYTLLRLWRVERSLTNLTTPVGLTATPTDRPKSVRNRCVIEVFGGVFYVVTMLCGFFCGCRGFCHRTESDLFLFLLVSNKWKENTCKDEEFELATLTMQQVYSHF